MGSDPYSEGSDPIAHRIQNIQKKESQKTF